MTSCIKGMRIAGFVLAVATCCGAGEASAQVFLNLSGGNAPAPGSAGSGIGSPTGNPAELRLGDTGIGSSHGLSIPLLNQGAGNAAGVTGNAVGTARGSSDMDRPSSPVDSVTNSLMGSVSNAVSRETNSATNPASKRKQNGNAGAASSSGRAPTAASKISPAGSP